MKKIVLPVLILFAMACSNAEKKETVTQVDSSLVKEMDSAVKITPDTSAKKPAAVTTKKIVKKKTVKQKTNNKKRPKQTASAKK